MSPKQARMDKQLRDRIESVIRDATALGLTDVVQTLLRALRRLNRRKSA